MEQASRRSKRARVAVDYARLDYATISDCMRVHHKKLARAVLKFEEQLPVEGHFVNCVCGRELEDLVRSTGFRNPCVVRAADATPAALGIRVPDGDLTVERIADLVGRNRLINTIDVGTQDEGPRFTMEEWVEYFSSASPRKPLLNVVSLDLDNTLLQGMTSAPSLVAELDLVDLAWPASVSPSPKVQLYTLMSVAGCFMDFHIDFGGSSVWYHVLSGRKIFLLVPPTKGNLMAYEEWASSEKQANIFFANRASGCQKVELGAGDTLFLHAAAMYVKLLKGDAKEENSKITKWEKEGLQTLTKWLSFWLGQMKKDNDTSQSRQCLIADLLLFTQPKHSADPCINQKIDPILLQGDRDCEDIGSCTPNTSQSQTTSKVNVHYVQHAVCT